MTRPLGLVLILSLGAQWPAAGQDPLARVRELYASADYEAALKSLDALAAGAGDQTLDIDRYRALCLIGLGQSAAAVRVIERIVTSAPMYQPGDADSSPAVRAAFDGVRRRLLPGLAHKLFSDAKAAYDRHALAEAAAKFRYTQEVLDSLDLSDQPDLMNLLYVDRGVLGVDPPRAPPAAALSPGVAAETPTEPAPAVPDAYGAGVGSQADPTRDASMVVRHRRCALRRVFSRDGRTGDRRVRQRDWCADRPVEPPRLQSRPHRGSTRLEVQLALRDNTPVKARKRVDVELRPR